MERWSGTHSLTGATYNPATTSEPMSAGTHAGTIQISGVSPAPVVRRLQLQINRNLYEQPQVGSIDLAGIGLGRFEVSGTVEVYFENLAAYSALHNHDTIGIEVTLGRAAGSRYTIALPSVKMTEGEPVAPGNNQSVLLPLGFQAIYDPTEACTMKITRAV